MGLTRPRGEQLRFASSNSGDHVLDLYLEAAERGGRSLADLHADIWTDAGLIRQDLFQFRLNETTSTLEVRVGDYLNPDAAWVEITTILRPRGEYASGTDYQTFDVFTYGTSTYLVRKDHVAASPAPDLTKNTVIINGAALDAAVASADEDAETATEQAAIATEQAVIATEQAGISTAKATISTTQAGIATAQADIATAKATIATTQAGIATTKAGEALASATAADESYDDTYDVFLTFDKRYLGAKLSDPTTDNQGAALVTGASYFNTATGALRHYNGSGWVGTSLADKASLTGAAFLGTISAPSVISGGNVVVRGGGAAAEGGQLVIGYGNNLATGITGQANNTWNLDVAAADGYGQLRLFAQDNAGTVRTALTANGSTGVVNFNARPTFGAATPWDSANLTPTDYVPKTGAAMTGQLTLWYASPTLALYDTGGTTNTRRGAWMQASGCTWYQIQNDAGAYISNPIQLSHTTGQLLLSVRPTWGGFTPWDTGNFDPATKFPVTGGTFTGSIAAPGVITSTGATAMLAAHHRDNFSRNVALYATAGVNRIWDSAAGDVAQFTNTSAALSPAGGNLAWGNGGAYVSNDGNFYMPWAGNWLSNVLGAKANLSSANFAALELQNGGPWFWLHASGVKRAAWHLSSDAGRLHWIDQGGQSHFQIGADGSVWTQQFGDLYTRIEDRASAHAAAASSARVEEVRFTGYGESAAGGYAVDAPNVITDCFHNSIQVQRRFRTIQYYRASYGGWVNLAVT